MNVAVKAGVTDPDYPDMPLGGWTGVICDADVKATPRSYRVAWSAATLDLMHPLHRRRCERDGFEVETMWLPESALQEHHGEPIVVEQPTHLSECDIDPDASGERVRAVFGLPIDAALPEVDEQSLKRYHRYLRSKLSFPFLAVVTLDEEDDPIPLVVMDLIDVDEIAIERGIECCAEAQVHGAIAVSLADLTTPHLHNRPLIEDYTDWYYGDVAADPSESMPPISAGWLTFFGIVFLILAAGTLCGIVLGASLGAYDFAWTAALVGMPSLAILGYVFGSAVEESRSSPAHLALAPKARNIAFFLLGIPCGALAGAVLITLPGMIVGAIACVLLTGCVLRSEKKVLPACIGALLGSLIQAYLWDWEGSLVGTGWGAALGASTAALVVMGFVTLAVFVDPRKWQSD